MKKLGQIFNTIFGYGVFIALLLGGLSFLGFLVAFFIAPEQASILAVAVQKQYFPWVIRLASVTVALGIAGMYLNGEQALSLATDKKEAEDEMKEIKDAQS